MNDLTDSNVLLFAAKNYDNPKYLTSEFEEDFKRIQYLQKLFYRYENKHELKDRLILNHLIVLYNCFGADAAARMLFLKITPKHWPALKTFMIYLNMMPEIVKGVNGKDIISSSIQLDQKIAHVLRKI